MRNWMGKQVRAVGEGEFPVSHGHPQMGEARRYGSVTCADSPASEDEGTVHDADQHCAARLRNQGLSCRRPAIVPANPRGLTRKRKHRPHHPRFIPKPAGTCWLTEIRDQHDRSMQASHPGVQRRVVPRGDRHVQTDRRRRRRVRRRARDAPN